MLRQGTASLFRLAVPVLLQQPVPVEQACVQLQVLSLQAVRFRGKPTFPKRRHSMTRADKLKALTQRAIDRATAAQASAQPAPVAANEPQQQADAAAAPSSQTSSHTSSQSSTEASSSPSSSTTSSSATTEQDSSGSGSSDSTWVPSWVGDMFSRRRSRPRTQRSPLTAPATVFDKLGPAEQEQQRKQEQNQQKQEQQKQDDGWRFLEQWGVSWSLDDYGQYIKNDPNSTDFERPPRPATPRRGFHALHMPGSFDVRRVEFYFNEQKYATFCALSPEDKLRLKLDPNIEKDPEALQEIADRANVGRHELSSLLHEYRTLQKKWKLLLQYRQAGNPMPPVQDFPRSQLLSKQLEQEHEIQVREELLHGRDVESCTLRQWNLPVNKARAETICPQTHLPFGECCGSRIGKRKGGKKPKQLLSTL